MSFRASSMHHLAIGYNNGNVYRINFTFMSKNNALNLIKNAVIIDKKRNIIKQSKMTFCLCIV